MQQTNIHTRQPTHAWRMFNRATAAHWRDASQQSKQQAARHALL
ncbi:hypothetical protein [Xanthomonas floridensis]|uniref:Uncharacterized protein n=1 Tax=Xanthomonas floridensis TaxID=1843580 RepID=A0ABU5PTY1_9XANT|nr:hypothetical protein [Xanthomonas floridensis]MEA5123056.1 hypothetical protein [Xanthomonas floridensis]MEA5130528.1 hypothetical protein [Xanthomonas floridensis]